MKIKADTSLKNMNGQYANEICTMSIGNHKLQLQYIHAEMVKI